MYMKMLILVHLCRRLEWAFLMEICPYCGKPYTFSSSPHKPMGQFQPNLASLWMKGIQICSNEGPCHFPRGENLKTFFSRTTGPISTKRGTKHPWVKGNQVYSNKEPFRFQKVDIGCFFLLLWCNHLCLLIWNCFLRTMWPMGLLLFFNVECL